MLDSLRHILSTAAALMQNRLRLLGIEMEEQADRLATLCGLTVALVGAAFMACSALIGIIFLSVEPSSRLAVFWWVFALSIAFALVVLWLSSRILHAMKTAFAQSIQELEQDREVLNPR